MDIKQEYREETNLDVYIGRTKDKQPIFDPKYIKWLEAKINYTRCCGALKKEETAFDLWLKNFKKTTYGYWYDENTIYCREAMSDIYKNEVKPTL